MASVPTFPPGRLALTASHVIFEYAWLAPLAPAIWVLLRTRITSTVAKIIRVSAWDWLLCLKGVPDDERHRLISDAARQDLKLP